MYNIFFLFSIVSFTFLLMKISPRKYEIKSKSALIISDNLSGYDHFWIINTSCSSCVLEISCNYLKLYSYHSIIFTSSFLYHSSDATFRNYSTCPYRFIVTTNVQGLYFIYHYFFYYKSRDYFNFSYSVIEKKQITFPKEENVTDQCFTLHFANSCSEGNHRKDGLIVKGGFSLHYNMDDIFANRFMHVSTNVGHIVYVHGGLSSKNITDYTFIRFFKDVWEIVPVRSLSRPPCLYAHSLTYYARRKELILFGGGLCDSTSVLNDNVWIFSLESGVWLMYKSLKVRPVMGHSVHVFQDIMYIFFGLLQSASKLSNLIQKFNMSSREWLKEIDVSTIGLMYHCSYSFGDGVLIFGGLYNFTFKQVALSNRLYHFNFITEEWKLWSDKGPRLYLHTCTVINNLFLAIGGLRADPFMGNIPRFNDSFNKWSQQLSSYLFIYNKNSKLWKLAFINYTAFGHQISTLKNFSTILISGGKTSTFRRNLILKADESCSVSRGSTLFECEVMRDLNLTTTSLTLVPVVECQFLQCDNCVRHLCAWCSLTKKCISKVHFASLYAIGGCEIPIFYESQCPIKCEHLTNSGCRNCTELSFCGWCEFRKSTNISRHLEGVGQCVDGTINGPLKSNDSRVVEYCGINNVFDNWYFIPSTCMNCTCNSHSTCSKVLENFKEIKEVKPQCLKCIHNSTGSNCQYCKDGYQGSAINGQVCTECKCVKEGYAGNCSPNGFCDEFCLEKGRIGTYCDECDVQKNFTKFHDVCAFKAKINFKYVLDSKTDQFNQYTNRINFLVSEIIPNMDLHFRIRCQNNKEAVVRVELFNDSGERRVLLKDKYCFGFETLFPKTLFKGLITYQLLFTVSGFQNSSETPFQLEMIFTQKTYINLPYIFISFFACLSASVLSFYTVYKLRQHINRRNRNYHTLFVMERPFAKIQLLDISEKIGKEYQGDITISSPLRKNCTFNVESSPHEYEIPNVPLLCVEPYRGNETRKLTSTDEYKSPNNNAVVSILFLSPICSSSKSSGKCHSSQQYFPRILIGSTITKLTKIDRKVLLELPTKSSSGNSIMVDRDFDTSVSPSAAEELLTTEV